jgi:predicted DNA-binding transcriptional regulator AlpA
MRASKDNPVERAQLLAALWQRPIVSDREAAQMVGLPRSTWAALKRSAGFPAQFSLGRRVFFRVDDLRAWLNSKATAAGKIHPRPCREHRVRPHFGSGSKKCCTSAVSTRKSNRAEKPAEHGTRQFPQHSQHKTGANL